MQNHFICQFISLQAMHSMYTLARIFLNFSHARGRDFHFHNHELVVDVEKKQSYEKFEKTLAKVYIGGILTPEDY